jgi:UDP-glucuronate 4-epimerase
VAHYLLTGAAGFIASRVADFLLEQGHSIIGVDNLNHAYDVRMKEYRLKKLLQIPGFTFIKTDITSRDAVSSLADHGSYDAVINLAARAGVRQAVEDPWVYVDTNLTGTLNLLEFCQQHKIQKFLVASTSSVYGANAPLPTPETSSSDYPLQQYAASKKAAEVMSHVYHHLYGLDVTVVRYFTVYGPAGRPDMVIFRFIKWIAEGMPVCLNGKGDQSRGFTYVDDIARGTIQALQPLGYEIINLGGHESITIQELIEFLESVIGRKADMVQQPFHPADMMSNLADVSKANKLLGWTPQVPLREGLRKAIDWYFQERDWASQIKT